MLEAPDGSGSEVVTEKQLLHAVRMALQVDIDWGRLYIHRLRPTRWPERKLFLDSVIAHDGDRAAGILMTFEVRERRRGALRKKAACLTALRARRISTIISSARTTARALQRGPG